MQISYQTSWHYPIWLREVDLALLCNWFVKFNWCSTYFFEEFIGILCYNNRTGLRRRRLAEECRCADGICWDYGGPVSLARPGRRRWQYCPLERAKGPTDGGADPDAERRADGQKDICRRRRAGFDGVARHLVALWEGD